MKHFYLICLALCFAQASAQTFSAEASLPSPETDGFYRILISPEVSVYLNNEITDIRIFDNNGREVPYVAESESPVNQAERFVEYEILNKESKSGCCTALMLRNASRTPINNIQLIIKNAEAARKASLRGSDDKKTWFALKDQFLLRAPASTLGTQQIEIVGFPWSNYEFYLLDIADSVNAPLNIVKAGYYETQSSNGNYTSLPVQFTSADSASEKKTYIKLTLDGLQFVDKIAFEVSGAKYYRRSASLLEKRMITTKQGKQTEYYRKIQDFELTSARTTIIELDDVRGQQFLVEISNGDNPPLSISKVNVFQLNRYLTAWLSGKSQYGLKFGATDIKAPNYDLAFFRDSIPEKVEVLQPSRIKKIVQAEAATGDTLFTNKNIIWFAIILVILVLGVMSAKLVREAAK
jgi:hypothetical protein